MLMQETIEKMLEFHGTAPHSPAAAVRLARGLLEMVALGFLGTMWKICGFGENAEALG